MTVEQVIDRLVKRTYYDIGHDEDAPVTLWVWHRGTLLTKRARGDELIHSEAWPELETSAGYAGRFDHRKKIVAIYPLGNHPGSVFRVPPQLRRALYDKFGDDIQIVEF